MKRSHENYGTSLGSPVDSLPGVVARNGAYFVKEVRVLKQIGV
jgi:hypothetical protein